MLVGILTGLVVALWFDGMFFSRKDKAARRGIEKLAEDLNREVKFYDFIEEASIFVSDYSQERAERNKMFELKMELHDRMNKLLERIDKVADTAEKTDLSMAKGVDELAKHLKLEIVPFREPEQNGFKIVKLKKSKK
jgi:hypothetical protein